MRFLLAVAVALSASAVGETTSKDFGSLFIKQIGGSTVSFTPSINWEGEKKPQNAYASMLISESGASGRVTLNQVHARISMGDLRKLHATLGLMIQEVEGKKRPAKKD
jgi:hypothetical protein